MGFSMYSKNLRRTRINYKCLCTDFCKFNYNTSNSTPPFVKVLYIVVIVIYVIFIVIDSVV